jgi:hypothetical protein
MKNNNYIPKKIFQTFQKKIFSKKFQEIIDTWKLNNPNYSYFIYDDRECNEFIKSNFPENIFNAYNSIIPNAYKADLWRYCILYIEGGIYVDIDTLCIGNIDSFLQEDIHLMTPVDLNGGYNEGCHNLYNTFIAVVPRSPIMLECIERIVKNVETKTIPLSKLDFSGPGVLGRSVNTHLERNEIESFIGHEGIIKNIKLLYFDKNTEYVSDNIGNILFQNKNGNSEIQKLYNDELSNIDSICWVNAVNILKI